MRGILSSAPAPAPIRLLVGTHLLLIVQALLVLRSAAGLDAVHRMIIVMTVLLAVAAMVAAIRGETQVATGEIPRWRRRHAR